MSSSDSWDELAERIAASQALSDPLSEEIDDLMPEIASSSWWVQLLKQHTDKAGLKKAAFPQPVQLVSACSGACAEAACFKDSGGSAF